MAGTSTTDAVATFLVDEADTLDAHDFDAWLAMLAPDIFYEVPIPTVGEGWPGYLLQETYETLVARVRRLQSPSAWSEHPPSRTRRLITNLSVTSAAGDDEANGSGAIEVMSNFALYCYRDAVSTPVILTGGRTDVLRPLDGNLRLARRTVALDATVLALSPLSVLL